MDETIEAKRKALRDLCLGEKADGFARKLVEFGGETFEVREPSVGERSEILKAAGVTPGDDKPLDVGKLTCAAVSNLVYVPGSNVRVFDPGDVREMLNKRVSGFMSALGDVAVKMLNVEDDELGKGSSGEGLNAQSAS